MRYLLATLLCSFGLAAIVSSGARADDTADVEKERKKFQGTWTIESVEAGGKKLPAEPFKEMTVIFDGDKYVVKQGGTLVESAIMKLDPSRSPKSFDSTVTEGPNKGAVILGIYELDGDTLRVCFDPQGKKRPTEFKGEPGSQTLVVHRRVKK